MWFEKLTGFKEENPDQVRENLILEKDQITSKVNGKTYKCGTLEIPSLGTLKKSSTLGKVYKEKLSITEVVGNVQELHKDPMNEGALFQAASQFNLLEMVGPHVTPESGIGIYERDFTQGPACAIACGAGTIYRNYFVPLEDQIGQTSKHQVDCLEDIGKALGNEELQLWSMKNGYALANLEGLKNITARLSNLNLESYENLKGKLKIGLQWDTQVTLSSNQQTVSQAYCSALPVAYCNVASVYWESFAKLILEATYDAVFYAALANYERTGNQQLFLTLVGGGAFGNELPWILDAIAQTVTKFRNTPLKVNIVSYGRSDKKVKTFAEDLNSNGLI